MSTRADELLRDFDDSGSEGESAPTGLLEDEGNATSVGPTVPNNHMDLDREEEAPKENDVDEEMVDGEIKPTEDAEAAKERIEKMPLSHVNDVRTVAGLMKTLKPLLEKIAHYKAENPEGSNYGNIEDNPEYHLLTQANSVSTTIDSEIILVHKFIRDHYSVRFEVLERLVENPLNYAKAVAILGNTPFDADSMKTIQDSKDNPLGVSLRSVLGGPTLMTVTLEATTSQGRQMTATELERVVRACKMVIDLYNAKDILTEYVQSRMNTFAPNLTVLVGSLTAAQLLNAAGGLTQLAGKPSRNLLAWGSNRKSNLGLATNIHIRQQGYIYHSPIVKEAPSNLKMKAMRVVSAKVILAANIDRAHQSTSGEKGEEFRLYCLDQIEKANEVPPSARTRALPVPDDKPSRKRGGRRARKAKEAIAITDLRKAQNRMAFGKEEKEVGYGTGDGTVGMGMIGAENDGRIRATQVDQRTRAKLSKSNKGWGAIGGMTSTIGGGSIAPGGMSLGGKGLRTSGVGTQIGGGMAGTMSSLAFTPVQGLELVDPTRQAEMSRKRKAEEDSIFNSGVFTQVGTKRVDMGAGKMGPPPLPRPKQ